MWQSAVSDREGAFRSDESRLPLSRYLFCVTWHDSRHVSVFKVRSAESLRVFAGGLHKIRVMRKDVLDPYLLLALLDTRIARRQMRSKQFTRDVIDTFGLPIPKDERVRDDITRENVLQNDWHKARYIETIPGAGYRFVSASDTEDNKPRSRLVSTHQTQRLVVRVTKSSSGCGSDASMIRVGGRDVGRCPPALRSDR